MPATATARLRALLEGQLAELSAGIHKEVADAATATASLSVDDEEGAEEAAVLALLNRTPPCSSSTEEDSDDDDGDDDDAVGQARPQHHQRPHRATIQQHYQEHQRLYQAAPAPSSSVSSSSWARHRLELRHAMDPGFILMQQLFRGWRACSCPRLALRRRGRHALRRLHARTVDAKRRMEAGGAADSTRLLRKGLRRLRARVACREAGERLAATHRAAMRTAAFRTWRAELRCRRHAQQRAKRLGAQCLAAWRTGIAAEKQSISQFDARLRLKRTWIAMRRAYAAKLQRADAAVCALAVQRARRCLRRWHWEANAKARLRRVRGSMATTLRQQLLSRRGLRALTAHAQAKKAALSALASTMEARAVRNRALHALWRLREKATRRQHACDAARRLQQRWAWRRFAEWRAWTVQRGWERCALAAHGRRARAAAVAKGFSRWRSRARQITAAAHVRQTRRRRLLKAMTSATVRSRDLRGKAQALAKQAGRQRLRVAVQWWLRMARFAEHQRVLQQRWAWRRWRLAASQRGLQRGIEEGMGGGHATARRLRKAWEAWRARAAQGRARRATAATGLALRERVDARIARGALWTLRRAWADASVAEGAEAAAARHWRRRQLRAAVTVLAQLARGRELGARTDAVAQRFWAQGRRRKALVALQLRRWAAESARRQAIMARRWRAWRGLAAWRALAERQRAAEEARALGEAKAEQQWFDLRVQGALGRLSRCVY